MAINLTLTRFQDSHGLDIPHSVIAEVRLNYIAQAVRIVVYHYTEAADFNAEKRPVFKTEYQYTIAELPASVITNAVTLKSTIETEMVTLTTEYLGGTIVNDDGTSI